jgi:hypothetical protein
VEAGASSVAAVFVLLDELSTVRGSVINGFPKYQLDSRIFREAVKI